VLFRSCITDEVGPEQVARLAVRYLEDHPAVLHLPAEKSVVHGGEKVGHGSGGVVLSRGARKGSQWLA
jgi:S-adenosylmethionine synthetase